MENPMREKSQDNNPPKKLSLSTNNRFTSVLLGIQQD
jgi:hypothetical protein